MSNGSNDQTTLQNTEEAAKQKLSENTEAMEKLEGLENTIKIWHESQQEKIGRQVILLTTMHSTMENIVDTFLKDASKEALEFLNEIKGVKKETLA